MENKELRGVIESSIPTGSVLMEKHGRMFIERAYADFASRSERHSIANFGVKLGRLAEQSRHSTHNCLFFEPNRSYIRLMDYIWEREDWPLFEYDLSLVEADLLLFSQKMGQTDGLLEGLSDEEQKESLVDLMVAEAVKTSEIEGEMLSRRDVMSSIKNNLGLNPVLKRVQDQRAEGIAEMIMDGRETYTEPLSEELLMGWHRMLMKGHDLSDGRLVVGAWRKHVEAMQVISGPVGREKVHFEAPPSDRVPAEMAGFFKWFNEARNDVGMNPLIHSALAHLYFETIHPFEDGNGRIGRAISEKALSQGFGRPVLLSLSRVIEAKPNDYYDALQAAQSKNKVSEWVSYFVSMVLEAQSEAEEQVRFTLKKAQFFIRYEKVLNARQVHVVRRMLKEGPKGFEGGMNARKYVSLTKVSKATATRDLQDLDDRGIFKVVGGGRSTRYHLELG